MDTQINKQIMQSRNTGLFNNLLRECEFKIEVKKLYKNGLMFESSVKELNIVDRLRR